MPKERFHIYLGDQLMKGCPIQSPVLFDMPAFFIGALSPDIFYYDLPLFSLPPLGDWMHSLIETNGISPIYDWITQRALEQANAEPICWGLGLACHFMADAAWHPLIDRLSGNGLDLLCGAARRLSPREHHRLIESEIEAFWLARSAEAQKNNYLPADFWGKRGRLSQIASHYLDFIAFAGGPAPGAGLSERRISRCFLFQNFLLRLFTHRMSGGRRDLLLSFPPTRFVGALVTPVHPVLPELFARAMPERHNPFSDSFMKQSLASLKTDFCRLLEQIARK